MKRTIVSLACALIAPVAFAQTSTTQPTTTTTETTTTSTTATGTVTAYEPGKTIAVKSESGNPVSYVLGKTVHFVNKTGREIKKHVLKPGDKVQVIYEKSGDQMVVSRVVLQNDN